MKPLETILTDPAAVRNAVLLNEELQKVKKVNRELIDTTSGSVVRYLPNGNLADFDFQFVKLDGSANTVTITPYTGQTILGLSSLVLTTQYEAPFLIFAKTTQDWVLI
jgi:hypothetical protein